MAYVDVFNLRYEGATLRNKVVVAVARAALAVFGEAESVPEHAIRIQWAQDALTDTQRVADRMLWGVIGSGTIATTGNDTPDNVVQTAVDALVTPYAKHFSGA